jgi:hypothetical protein
MPSIKREDDETEQAFTNRVEAAIAQQMNLQPTKHTAADKVCNISFLGK